MYKRSICLASLCLVLGLASVAPAKLVAHWKLDDGSGTTARDSSGNGFDGTLIGGPTWVVGTDGGALEFDGLNDYVDFGNPAGWPAGKSPRTLCGWGKTNSVSPGYRWMAAYGSEGTGLAVFIGLSGSTLFVGGYGDDISFNNGWKAGEWCHVAVTYDGTTAKAYLNGKEVGSAPKNWNTTLGRAHIGRQVNNYAEFWNGAVDDVRLYDTALKASEVKALIPPKLKAYNPNPANGTSGVTFGLFGWVPGETAVFDAIYFGTTADLTAANFVVKQPSMYKFWLCKETLVPGQRYYWRVDSLDGKSSLIATGDVWSFFVTPVAAWAPKPGNGAAYIDPNVTLEWTAGLNASGHDVYFGTDRAAVEAGTGDTRKATGQFTLTYEPGPLARGVTYYWRVDEIADSTVKGDVWSFTVRPIIARADPNLVGWWKLDDEGSGTAVDYSGWDVYGELRGAPQWVEGCYGDALQLDGDQDYVDFGNPPGWPSGTSPRSLCGWGKTDSVAFGWRWIAAYGGPGVGTAMFIGTNGTDLYGGGYADDVYKTNFWEANVWHHICLTYDGTTARLYADGVEVASAAKSWSLTPSRAHIGRQVNDAVEFWDGAVDDVRIYNKALTPEEVLQTMRGDTLLAWNPQPKMNANVDIRSAETLAWSPGDGAVQHDVYLGTDRNAVKAATAGSPEYRGRQSDASYSTAGIVTFGGGGYFWRIDEVEADGTTIHKGSIWGFTVPDYLIVDDFEGYTDDVTGRVFQTWIDGWGYTEPAPGNSGNGTGATVGYTSAPFAERTIVHSGGQSMPFAYNNAAQPYYSEAERTWADPQDWTVSGVTTLSLQVQGFAPLASAAVTETGGKMTLSGSGTDIWNNSDEFTYAYKTLSGDATIVARVTSNGTGSDTWAKGGVMIRGSLDGGSVHAMMVITGGGGNGASFQYRTTARGGSGNYDSPSAVALPCWVKLERVGNTFTGYTSADGISWAVVGMQDVAMNDPVYVGICVTANAPNEQRTYQFESIKTTGSVTGPWQGAVISSPWHNSPQDLYVVVQDSAGKSAVVSNATAVNSASWVDVQMPLGSFTGVNMTKVKKMVVGVGNRNVPVADGTGMLFIDDIRLIKP